MLDSSSWVVNIKDVFVLGGLLTHVAIRSHGVEQGKKQSHDMLIYLQHS